MERESSSINLTELELHFDYIYGIINSEINIYDNDLGFQVLSLVFFKRMHDMNVEIYRRTSNDINWRELRNLAAHTYKDYERNLKVVLESIFEKINYEFIDGIYDDNYLISKYNVSKLAPIILFLDTIDLSLRNVSIENMGIAYEKLVKKFLSKERNEYNANENIIQLATKIINVKPGESLYDPTMGIGVFFTEVFRSFIKEEKENNLLRILMESWSGQEINRKSFALCRMNLMMNGIDNINIYYGDVILEPENFKRNEYFLFDKAISEIPMYKKMQGQLEEIIYDKFNRFKYGIPPKNSMEYGYIQHIISSINDYGKAVAIVPMKCLYSKGNEQKIRANIIEEDFIECIIGLPLEMSKNNKIEKALVVFNKHKEDYKWKRILFIDTTNRSQELNKSDIELAVKTYRNFAEIEGYSTIIELNEIRDQKYDLNYRKYSPVFKENQILLNEGKGKKIKDIIYLYQDMRILARKDFKQNVRYVRIKDLNKSITEQYIDFTNIENKVIDKSCEVLRENTILVSLLGDNLKPTIVGMPANGMDELVLDPNIVSLMPKQDIIDFEYLYYQLYSPRVLQQVESARTGTISRISRNDFWDIVISVPSIEVQREYVREQKLLLIEMEKLRYEETAKVLDLEELVSDAEETVISILAHNTLPYIARMQFDINIIKKFLEDNNLIKHFCNEEIVIEKEDEFGEIFLEVQHNPNKETLNEVIERVEKIVSTFENIISETKKTVQLNLRKEDFELINLKDIFDEIIAEKAKEYQGKYDLMVDCPDIMINLHKPSIKELFIQILRNAEMHAFKYENNKRKNKIEFKVMDKLDKVIITYINNGKPFKITKEEYIKMGKKSQQSTGNGLGGAYIYKVIRAHKGDIRIIKMNIGMKMEIELSKEGKNE